MVLCLIGNFYNYGKNSSFYLVGSAKFSSASQQPHDIIYNIQKIGEAVLLIFSIKDYFCL